MKVLLRSTDWYLTAYPFISRLLTCSNIIGKSVTCFEHVSCEAEALLESNGQDDPYDATAANSDLERIGWRILRYHDDCLVVRGVDALCI